MALTKIVTDMLTDLCVTGAKIAANTITGEKIALGSDAQGDIMYYDGTDWARLAAGTSGYFLKTQGAGANPVWAVDPTVPTYDSGTGTAAAADSVKTFAHGRAALPTLWTVVLKCNDEGGDAGYAENDEILVASSSMVAAAGDEGLLAMADSDSIDVVFGASVIVPGKSTFNQATLTLSKWDVVARAWGP